MTSTPHLKMLQAVSFRFFRWQLHYLELANVLGKSANPKDRKRFQTR